MGDLDAVDVEPSSPLLSGDAALRLDKALSVTAAAVAAWYGADRDRESKGLDLSMQACALVARARADASLPALQLGGLLAAVAEPAPAWLPNSPAITLLEEGRPTPLCEELAEDLGPRPADEVEQKLVLKVMDNLRGMPDREARYRGFRRFLIEHPTARIDAAIATAQDVLVDVGALYERISPACERDGNFYPCPRCKWPMVVEAGLVSCARSLSCVSAGARFSIGSRGLVALGPLVAPSGLPTEGWASLRRGLWRYTTLPGLAELQLAKALTAISGTGVTLWPLLDEYDLDVRRGSAHWRVDVKDYALASSLARRLNERPALEPTWIVIPDERRDQVRLLERAVRADARYAFSTVRAFVRTVKEAR